MIRRNQNFGNVRVRRTAVEEKNSFLADGLFCQGLFCYGKTAVTTGFISVAAAFFIILFQNGIADMKKRNV